VVQKKQLSCVFQRSAKETCRFVQEMHESPNCARNTGQEEKGQPGARARQCSRVPEGRASTLEQRRGARCLQYEQEALVSGRMSRN
jgi:hypothetical protein